MNANHRQTPAYLRVYGQLRAQIRGGVYKADDRLPSKRNLAERHGVSVITIEHALALLAEEGYIQPRQRSGCYVIYREADGFAADASAPAAPALPAYDFDRETALPFGVVARAMRRTLSEYGEAILTKAPNSGCVILRRELSKYLLRSRGIQADPEQIVIGSGAEYLYGLIVETLGRDLTYALESPSYEKIEQVYRARGVRCELLPLGRDGIEPEALAGASADVLHITPYRSYPSGVTASASRRRDYILWSERGARWIVEDDFESEFTPLRKPEETLFAQSPGGRVIYLNTFSMTVSPSLRAGYMVLPSALLPLYQERVGFYSCTVPAFEQYVLADLIARGDFERHINRVRRRKRRQSEEASKIRSAAQPR